MTAEAITREEIEGLPDVLAEMESRLHFGGDPEDDRPATEVWSELWFCDADYMLVFKAARLALSEPTRLAAARAEGYREGVEDARQAVDGVGEIDMASHERAYVDGWEAGIQAMRSEIITAIAALTPPPAEPSAPVAPRHPSCVSDPDAPDGLSRYIETETE